MLPTLPIITFRPVQATIKIMVNLQILHGKALTNLIRKGGIFCLVIRFFLNAMILLLVSSSLQDRELLVNIFIMEVMVQGINQYCKEQLRSATGRKPQRIYGKQHVLIAAILLQTFSLMVLHSKLADGPMLRIQIRDTVPMNRIVD